MEVQFFGLLNAMQCPDIHEGILKAVSLQCFHLYLKQNENSAVIMDMMEPDNLSVEGNCFPCGLSLCSLTPFNSEMH